MDLLVVRNGRTQDCGPQFTNLSRLLSLERRYLTNYGVKADISYPRGTRCDGTARQPMSTKVDTAS